MNQYSILVEVELGKLRGFAMHLCMECGVGSPSCPRQTVPPGAPFSVAWTFNAYRAASFSIREERHE